MIRIGITGGVGSGKSAVMQFLQENCRCVTFKSDDCARSLMAKGGRCYDAVLKLFGQSVLAPDGEFDRGRIAAEVFSDPEKLAQLNGIIHPAVIDEIHKKADETRKKGIPYFFLESALLTDKNYRDLCDELWYVYADERVRRKRLKESRGYSDERITDMIGSQKDERAFRESCDFVIDNSGDLQDACRTVLARLKNMEHT